MEEENRKHLRVRSPGYPMIDLKEAITKAKVLWDKDKNNPIPREVAAEHLGYGSAGGHGGRVIAALKHFDLIYMKEGDIVLTEKAVDLVLHSPSDKAYIDTVKNIALNPIIYADLFNEYNGELPSDSTLKVKLIKDYKFNADKVDRFVNNFRNTISFAGLGESFEGETEYLNPKDIVVSPEEIAKARVQRTIETMKARTMTTGVDAILRKEKSFDIPLLDGNKAKIIFDSYPLEEDDINLLKQWFEIYAPALKKKKDKVESTEQH